MEKVWDPHALHRRKFSSQCYYSSRQLTRQDKRAKHIVCILILYTNADILYLDFGLSRRATLQI